MLHHDALTDKLKAAYAALSLSGAAGDGPKGRFLRNVDRTYYTGPTSQHWRHQIPQFLHLIGFNNHEMEMLRLATTTDHVFDPKFLAPFRPTRVGREFSWVAQTAKFRCVMRYGTA